MATASNAPQDAQRKRGYRRLAEFMAWDPATAIFPRFQVANLNNLLLMQVEISELEEKLNDAVDADDKSNGENRRYSCDWSTQAGGHKSPVDVKPDLTYKTCGIQYVCLYSTT